MQRTHTDAPANTRSTPETDSHLEPDPKAIVSTAERQMAVRHWLLAALDGPGRDRARQEWDSHGTAFFRLGLRFSAVRFHARLVHGVAGTAALEGSDAYLVEALDGGPVICDPYSWHYYALLPPSALERFTYPGGKWGVERLGSNSFLGVPRVERTAIDRGDHASYWASPMPSAGELCDARSVARLLDAAVRQAQPQPGSSA